MIAFILGTVFGSVASSIRLENDYKKLLRDRYPGPRKYLVVGERSNENKIKTLLDQEDGTNESGQVPGVLPESSTETPNVGKPVSSAQ